MPVFITSKGDIEIPIGSDPSSHIIKPSMIGHAISETAINETVVMTLAKSIGMSVPDVQYLPELNSMLITRYDRKRTDDGTILRLHQNDFCQLLGVPADQKYESKGGPTLKQCFETVAEYSVLPEIDKYRMVEWLFFNLAVGNMDSHAKNISLLSTNQGFRLAPFYDMICTTAYRFLQRKFAFKIGGEDRIERIKEYHWKRFADDIEMDITHIKDTGRIVCENIEKHLPEVYDNIRQQVSHKEGLEIITLVNREVLRCVESIKSQFKII